MMHLSMFPYPSHCGSADMTGYAVPGNYVLVNCAGREEDTRAQKHGRGREADAKPPVEWGAGERRGDVTLSAIGRENESRSERKMRRAFNFVKRKRKLIEKKKKAQ